MRRLFDDPQLPAELREDLLRSRAAGQDYPAAAKLLQLRAAIADPARQPLGESSRWMSALEQAVLRLGHPGWKLAVLLAIGAGGAFLLRPAPETGSRTTAAPSQQLTAAVKSVEVAAPAASPPEAAAPTPAAPVTSELAAPAAPAAQQAKSSRREIAQLVRIRALLDRDPAAAYRLALQSEREYPRGVLSEEREALSILALAKSGSKDAAARRGRAFLARHPQTPLRELVEAALR